MICYFNQHAQFSLASMNSTNQRLVAHQTPTSKATPKTTNYWQSKSKHAKKLLSPSFVPSDYSVICGRTKTCFDSVGNRRFKLTIAMFGDEYREAAGRAEKSKIVSRVFNLIKESSPEGAFVTFEKGSWYECSERISREKIGAAFRDLLHDTYKSSSKSKQARKNSTGSASDDESSSHTTVEPSPQQEQQLLEVPQEILSLPAPVDSSTEIRPIPLPLVEPFAFPAFYDVDNSNTRHFYPIHNHNANAQEQQTSNHSYAEA